LAWPAVVVMDVKCRRLEGKVAVVTASTQGIGLAIAERLGLEGAAVVISSRKQVQQLSRHADLLDRFFDHPFLLLLSSLGVFLAAAF
jgi:NAD(P)-dependent dehydrogenase (short-subunit alcohol dehydrogenase family)